MERNKFPSKIDHWETLDKNNPTIVLNILYIKDKEICLAYISKINLNCEKKTNSINDSKWDKRKIALSYCKSTVYVIKRNSVKTSW